MQEQSSWRTLVRLWPLLARYQARVWLAAGALLVAAIATLAIPVAFRLLIDRGFVSPDTVDAIATTQSATQSASGQVTLVFTGLFALAVVLAISTAIRFYCVAWIGERVTTDLRNAVFARVLRQDAEFFESLRAGEVLSRLSTDTTLIQSLVGSSISLGLRNAILFIGALVMMIVSSPPLAGIIVGLLLLVVLPILVFGRRVRRLSRDSQDRLADTGALAGETLNAMQVVQAYVRESMESARYASATEAAFVSSIRRNRSRALLTALSIVLVFGAIVFVLWLGAHAVIDERMSAGLLAQFMLYAALVGGTAGVIAEVYGDVQRAAGATERLMELHDARSRILSGEHPLHGPCASQGTTRDTIQDTTQGSTQDTTEGVSDAPPGGMHVRFDAVSFSYPSRPDERSLDAVSFVIEPGETVALVGPSGAGKSTVFQLLLRFYDPAGGAIRLDGNALPDLQLDALRESIGLVSQDSVVFSANALENIRYGNLAATDAQVHAAARAAQADEFIVRLADGYDTYLGERGVRLSGGQRQRIAIARALLKNPPLLLLDEATSALDTESERRVQQALDHAMCGRSTLVIAHRFATIVRADRIMVMQDGRIVDTGTHQQLLARGGLYARLAAMQFDELTATS